MNIGEQIYSYGAVASGALCLLVSKDPSFINVLLSALFSWGGFIARVAAALLK